MSFGSCAVCLWFAHPELRDFSLCPPARSHSAATQSNFVTPRAMQLISFRNPGPVRRCNSQDCSHHQSPVNTKNKTKQKTGGEGTKEATYNVQHVSRQSSQQHSQAKHQHRPATSPPKNPSHEDGCCSGRGPCS